MDAPQQTQTKSVAQPNDASYSSPHSNVAMSERIAQFLVDENASPIHNFVGTPAEIWRLTARCTSGGAVKYSRSDTHPIEIVHWYMHRQEMTNDKTGEVTNPIRTVVLDDSGNAYAWMSGGIAKSLQTMVEAMGPGPYDPPLRVIPREIDTRRGMRLWFFEPA